MTKLEHFLQSFGGISRALSNKEYRIYWFGQIVMVQGFWIYKIAAGWLMWEMTNSSSWLGFLAAAYFLPVLFLGPAGGALADHFGHKYTAVIMGLLGSLISIIAAILTWTGNITPISLLLHAMSQGIAFSFEFPARQSLLPTLVGKGDMPAAVAVNSTTFYTSSFTGPIFGGLLLAIGSTEFGAGLSFITNAICMAWMVGALTFLRAPRDQNINKKKIFNILGNVSSGFVYSYKDKNIRLLILLLFSGSFFIRPYLDFLPEFSDKVFQTGKEGLSLLTAFSGIGSIFFAVFFAIRGRVDGLTLYLIYSQIGAMIFFILFAISENFAIGLILLSALGGLLVSSSIAVQSLIQHSVSDTYRARVISIVVSIAVGSPAISAMAIGWLSKYLGLQNSLIISGIIGIVITVLLSIKLMKRQHEIES